MQMKDPLGHGSNAGAHSQGIQGKVPRLTRAHFEHIAETLRSSNADDAKISAVISQLKLTNPGFNADRFRAAVKGDSKGQGRKSRASSRANAATRAGNFVKKLGV
jgi:hypothetical protein